MHHCIANLRTKEVINKHDGCRLGRVCDVDIDVCTGQVVCLVICRCVRMFGRYGTEEDIRIPWCDVDIIGDDIILVCYIEPPACKVPPKAKVFSSFFR